MNGTSQPLVSIVTPVYNEEQYLAECIESVLAQTYQNWDYTIIDNCSTDGSLEIARRYAAKDPRIRIHENEQFLNVIANHNVAVRQISPTSKYCKVVLGDDWIFSECLEKMVAVAEAYPSAGVVSAYQLHGDQVRSTGLPYQKTLVGGREACRQFLFQKALLFGTQNSVLYRADLVRTRNPFYLESELSADFEVCFALLKNSDLGFVHQVLTFSRVRAGSIGAVSSDMGANLASQLGLLFAHGRECLTEEEFKQCLELQLSQYYTFLGRRLWVERDRDFWRYHKRAFRRAGIAFNGFRLAGTAIRELCRTALEPNAAAERIRRMFQLKEIRKWQKRRVVLAVDERPSSGREDGG